MSSRKQMANYIDNKEFHQCLVNYKKKCDAAEEAGKPRPRLPDYFGQAVWDIATNYSSKPSFSGYSYRDEMISDAVEACIRYADRYDTTRAERLNVKPNPLSYFTQISHYAFLNRIDIEHKQQYVKALSLRSNPNIIEGEDDNFDGYDKVIVNYERRLADKRRKATERKQRNEAAAREAEANIINE